ncbi:MAG TPA: amidohydrolase family protein [Gemmatimonadaceae bacterium]|nr:amidohydrolase family protein [Gemmatimonadaceae bacterium]
MSAHLTPVAALVVLLATPAAAQVVAITGGRVFPVSGPPIDNATVVIRDGKIAAVGANVTVPDGAQRIDATGKWVTPGLINSATTLGLVEISAVGETRDVSARGRDAIAAAVTVWEGVNPISAHIGPAREDGMTSAVLMPDGGLIAGQAALVDLVGTSVTDMVVRAPVAMVAEVGNAQAANLGTRAELLVKLREILDDTRTYMRRRADYDRAQTRDFAASRLDLEAMIPVVQGRLPLLVQADLAADIQAALRLAREFSLKLMIAGGADAWRVADELAAARVPVLSGAMNNIPQSFATLGHRQENAALLRQRGVSVAIIGNAGGGEATDAFNASNIRYEAGNAVAYGMTWDDALRAVTLTPAELFGVADRIGSLQPGRDANVVVWSGDPFEFATRAEHVLIRGRELDVQTRPEQLMDRYMNLDSPYRRP